MLMGSELSVPAFTAKVAHAEKISPPSGVTSISIVGHQAVGIPTSHPRDEQNPWTIPDLRDQSSIVSSYPATTSP
ncbi:hypothetical protein PG996_004989 [Apiospora saccharicola]|uniref:Uncharacterized protein n=1 Tax=Apiospora saccharicola TaxID=335842 RepID=A0ABR1VK81_9PEZI